MGRFLTADLNDAQQWDDLHAQLDSSKRNGAIKKIVAQLQDLGARGCLIEEQYLDKDFTEVFSNFYSRVFKPHHKICKRFHFFSAGLAQKFQAAGQDAGATFDRLREQALQDSYLGFVVIRPVQHAPLQRAVLALSPQPVGSIPELMVRSVHETHVSGAPFKIEGAALTQQDSRVGSCAQAAIWMAGRHFYNKRRGPWFSTTAITEAATKLADVHTATMLPLGSESLHPNNMIQALKAMEREAFIYTAVGHKPGTSEPNWSSNPLDIVHRYLDSDIPVILGMQPLPGQSVGHAVVATGADYGNSQVSNIRRPTKAAFIKYILVNDDQRGSNIRVALAGNDPNSENTYTIKDNLIYLLIPLPKKVFLTGEHAELLAWDFLGKYQNGWPQIKQYLDTIPNSDNSGGVAFNAALQQNEVVARSYLTYGWKYKARMLANDVHPLVKLALLDQDMPRYVWVTEFGIASELSDHDIKNRFIYSHVVVDATASKMWEARLLFHAPGNLVIWRPDQQDTYGPYKETTEFLSDDSKYRPKLRGYMDLAPFL